MFRNTNIYYYDHGKQFYLNICVAKRRGQGTLNWVDVAYSYYVSHARIWRQNMATSQQPRCGMQIRLLFTHDSRRYYTLYHPLGSVYRKKESVFPPFYVCR